MPWLPGSLARVDGGIAVPLLSATPCCQISLLPSLLSACTAIKPMLPDAFTRLPDTRAECHLATRPCPRCDAGIWLASVVASSLY